MAINILRYKIGIIHKYVFIHNKYNIIVITRKIHVIASFFDNGFVNNVFIYFVILF
jgi:hypothetical protein